jgi:cob(I)alamin adenosyltransferase
VGSLPASYLADPEIGLVVLDEMTYAFKYGWLDSTRARNAAMRRPCST